MALPTSMRLGGTEVYGVVLGIAPATAYAERLNVEIWGSTSNSTAATAWGKTTYPPSTRTFYQVPITLPYSTKLHYFKARHTGVGFAAGSLSTAVSAYPTLITRWASGQEIPSGSETQRRFGTISNTDAVVRPSVTQNDGTISVPVVKGWLTGTANGGRVPSTSWTDGAAVVFTQTYDSAPAVALFPGAGTVYLERRAVVWSSSGTFNTTAPQYVDLAAINVTAAGFTPRARLIQRSTALTARTANFGTSNNLNVVGEATSATIANAPSVTDSYIARYKWRITGAVDPGTTATATLTVAFDSNSTGAYTERATATHVATITTATTSSSNSHAAKVLSISGLSSTEEIRVRIKSYAVSSPYTSATLPFSVHAFDSLGGDPAAGVTYNTVTSPNYAAMCPSTLDVITWTAQSVVTG